MKVTRLPLSISLLAALPLAVGFGPATDKLDLSPRFDAGESYSFSQTFKAEGGLDELEVLANGAPAFDGGAIAADVEVEGEIAMSEEILEMRDGEISKLRVTVDTMEIAVTGEVDAMGEGDSIDESIEPELVGRTIEITIDEDGEVTRVDVTKDVEALDESMLAAIGHENHFEMLLPSDPVEEGEEFELAPDWEELLRDGMANMDVSEMGEDEMRAAEGMMNALIDATTLAATGKVTGVEDGVATIEYDLAADMNIDDLVALIQSIAPPGEMDQVPPGIESMIEATAEFSGTGTFDMNIGQMTSLELAGDFEMSISGSADIQGTAVSADVLLNGTMEIAATLTKE